MEPGSVPALSFRFPSDPGAGYEPLDCPAPCPLRDVRLAILQRRPAAAAAVASGKYGPGSGWNFLLTDETGTGALAAPGKPRPACCC